tara:strand:+ start:128 stop:1846 length:1719 start_codon:yes stop_codon:yes gene_type:complete
MLTPSKVRHIVKNHDNYWSARRPRMRELRAVYRTQYYPAKVRADNAPLFTSGIELSRGYEFVQGYMASLFSRNPAVVATAAIDGKGNKDIAQSVANNFIAQFRSVAEDAARNALIYPNCAIKFAICGDYEDAFTGIEAAVVMPWDLLVDRQAMAWAKQRYVGHRYWMPVEDANEKWGVVLQGQVVKPFLDQNAGDDSSVDPDEELNPDAHDLHVLVYEFYDMKADRLFVWCAEHMNGEAWLYDGAEFEDGDVVTKYTAIPFRTARDKPVCPIAPLFFGRMPDDPLIGYSALERVYAQLVELIEARNFQAQAVRKCGRQLIAQKGVLLEGEAAKFAAGIDGALIEVADTYAGQDVRTLIAPVPMQPAPPEVEEYVAHVESDIQRASMLNGMVFGQSNGGTATEVTAQAAYSNSLVGEMARERDEMVTTVCTICLSMMRVMLEGGEPEVVLLDGETKVIRDEDLAGDFRFFALDGGGTPQSSIQKLNDLRNDTQALLDMGVDKRTLLEKRLHLMGMPELMPKEAAVEAPAPAAAPVVAAGPPVAEPVVPDEGNLGLSPGALPSPEKIQAVLPQV